MSSNTRYKLLHLHKLDNVPLRSSPVVTKQGVIRVQFLHGREVLVSHAHNDDGQRKIRGVYDCTFGGIHVGDNSVRDNQEDKVVAGVGLVSSSKPRHMANDVGEVGWSVELNIVQ